jgi:hypothetical protein
MSRDTPLKAPDGSRYSMDNLATQKWLNGHIPGAEQAIGWLKEEAVSLFRQGDTIKAIYLQGLAKRLADEVLPGLIKNREIHERDYPYEIEKGKHI